VSFEAGTDVVDYQIAFGGKTLSIFILRKFYLGILTHVCSSQTSVSTAMPNHHCLLHSLNPEYPEPSYNDALVNRFVDPGAGAFSYNMGREFTVYHNVQAGSELFLDYGVSE
jgi:hypothetical protein